MPNTVQRDAVTFRRAQNSVLDINSTDANVMMVYDDDEGYAKKREAQ